MLSKKIYLFTPFIFITACTTVDETNPTAGASWYSTMHRISANQTALTSLVADPKEFYDPKNAQFIKEKTNEITKAAAELTKDAAAPNADPIITFTADQFSKDMQDVSAMLDTGKMQPAHYSLSQMNNYCISCHSRADRGSKNFPLPWIANLSRLNAPQKAMYYLANRQYETAHKQIESVVKDETLLSQDPAEWMNVIQKDLAVMVRVQQDLTRAQKIVDSMLANKSLPSYIKSDVVQWSKSLKDWQKEKGRTIEGTKNLAFVKTLLDLARTPPYIEGQSGFIIYLRASGILHELLESSRKSSTYSSALYFAGITAEALKTVDVWRLGEHYFEVCIETSPGTAVSQKCYRQLEDLVEKNHSHLNLQPDVAKEIKNRLAKYRDLSRVQTPSPEKIRPNESGPRY